MLDSSTLLSLVARLCGHSVPRAHRGTVLFSNLTITFLADGGDRVDHEWRSMLACVHETALITIQEMLPISHPLAVQRSREFAPVLLAMAFWQNAVQVFAPSMPYCEQCIGMSV